MRAVEARPTPPSSIRRACCAGDHVDEVLEVLRGPALEGPVAIGLVGRHHRVAVVPVELRLRIEPEGAAGVLGDPPEGGGVWLTTIGSRVAEHDDGRARSELIGDLLAELEPDPAVVRVAGDVSHAALG